MCHSNNVYSEHKEYGQIIKEEKIDSLEIRRKNQSLKFAINALKHPKFKQWFIPDQTL